MHLPMTKDKLTFTFFMQNFSPELTDFTCQAVKKGDRTQSGKNPQKKCR